MRLTEEQKKHIAELIVKTVFAEFNDHITRNTVKKTVDEYLWNECGSTDHYITIDDDPDIVDMHGFEMKIWFAHQEHNLSVTLYPDHVPIPENANPEDIHIRIGRCLPV